MACPTCPGNRSRANRQTIGQQSPRFRASRLAETDETVLVEFTGTGSRTVTPPGSGMTYRFGQDEQHRQRRVRRVDAPRILANAQFRLVAEAQAQAQPEPTGEAAEPRGRGRPRTATANVNVKEAEKDEAESEE